MLEGNSGAYAPPDGGDSVWLVGDRITVKLTSEETGGVYSVAEEISPPQGGPPPHIHSQEDETFYVLEGEVEFLLGEDTIVAGAGSCAYAPTHTGTHMDAPIHFVRGGEGMDRMPLEAAVGRARVIEIQDPVSIKPDELDPHGIGRGQRVLFKTRNSARRWWAEDFIEDFVYVSQEAARYLADLGARTVGVDYLSVGGFYRDGAETHQALLGAGIWIIEGLDLSGIEPGEYELICLPIKVEEGDGAPARAVLRAI